VTAPGRTPLELARRLACDLGTVTAILHDLRAQGIAEEGDEGRWRLTATADRTLGRALRELAGSAEFSAFPVMDTGEAA
jgi:DNA-binding IclR family transcriptional regulator